MAYCIIGVNFENKVKVKELGANLTQKVKLGIFMSQKTKLKKQSLKQKSQNARLLDLKL